jgi:hypothetical protein
MEGGIAWAAAMLQRVLPLVGVVGYSVLPVVQASPSFRTFDRRIKMNTQMGIPGL